MIERLDHPFVYICIELGQIGNHAGGGIDCAGKKHFQYVIVAMAVGIIALSKDTVIFYFRKPGAVQAVRSREVITASERDVQSFAH